MEGAAMVSAGVAALNEARNHIGYKESPAESNRTVFGQWFGENGVPWCNIFVSYCFKVGAGYTICQGFNAPGVTAKGSAYVPSTEKWLRATGQWIGYKVPKPGDIAVFNWDGGEPDHIGIVEEYLGNGEFRSVEGNTSYDNQSNGGEVMRRVRHIKNTDGFGRIAATVDMEARLDVDVDGRRWLRGQRASNQAMWARVRRAAKSAKKIVVRRNK